MKKTKTKSSSELLSFLPKELTTVTPLSKLLAVIVFILLPFMGFFLGIRYEQFNALVRSSDVIINPVVPTTPSQVACTMDAMMCPDGSYVGRTGPQCEFAACPMAN